jgi:hypothetical protein
MITFFGLMLVAYTSWPSEGSKDCKNQKFCEGHHVHGMYI